VRVLWALPRGAGWERSVRVWEKAVAAVAAELGGTLPMRLVALPLDEFLAQPDWGADLAKKIYAEARPGYHEITRAAVDKVVK